MKNQWLHFWVGKIHLKLTGEGIERFLNDCTRQDISVLNVQFKNEGEVRATFLLKDLSKIRTIIRKHPCKIHFTKSEGAPFWQKRLLKNVGFVCGTLLCLFVILFLSNMVWSIEIKGANPKTEHEIMKKLDELGVKVGKSQFAIDDPETLQKKITDDIEDITWIGVELRGTSYHFQVVEKKAPKESKGSSPQNLIAKKKAIINYMFVEKGQPIVEVNEHVEKGQTLVSGVIGNEKESKSISAKGEILGEVWYKSTVEVPIKTEFEVLTGESKTKHSVSLFGGKLPFWGFFDDDYKTKKKEKIVKPVYFFNWKTPLKYEKQVIRENEKVTRQYTKKEAVKRGLQIAREDLLSKVDGEAKIVDENVLHQTTDNGKVKLVVYYQVIENIVGTQPIIQGD
ncbi:sporulation protein YqfD [Priestia filamentosa]|uniref:sporulation protein YqfD n=1 Tax=Priestia filamentosa TaxID=1402861 RepID=UPI001FB4F822|nr:sporulation protein YqfD [Priestia filamentosa]MED3725375.1 sporulation protein YqfD [Priestia filamentosa]UOE61378.1 sporulation protein YqfD [Priestia filamentosa]